MFHPFFRNTTRRLAALAAALSVLAGCASAPGRDDTKPMQDFAGMPLRADMQIDHALPMISADENDEKMLAGSLNLESPSGLLDYGARYEIHQGKLFRAIQDGEGDPQRMPDEIALQTLEHTLGSTLSLPAGPPLKLALTRSEQTRLGLEQGTGGGRHKQSTQAEVQWSPGPVDVQVRWQQAARGDRAATGLDCNLRADMTLPANFVQLADDSVLEFSAQRCRARTPERNSAQPSLARWGAAWRWGEHRNNVVHFQHTESTPRLAALGVPTPEYELGLSHVHALSRDWEATAHVSLLRQESTRDLSRMRGTGDSTDWSADIALTRDLDLMAVTARWARAAERIWFAAATRQVGRDRFSLALDFGTWLARLWPRVESAMDVSWNWRRTREGESDGKLSWNVLIDW